METVKKIVAWWKHLSTGAKVGLVALVVGSAGAVAVVANLDAVMELADSITTEDSAE